jgi:hypothetical protein
MTSEDKADYGMPIHPLCELFPLMDADSLAGLVADIRLHGLLSPIIVPEGQVVDGRNRLLACREAGITPRLLEWAKVYQGPIPLAHWIWSVNGERRHLTLDQITAAQVAIRAWEEQEAARQRQIEAGQHGKEGGRGHKKPLGTERSPRVCALDESSLPRPNSQPRGAKPGGLLGDAKGLRNLRKTPLARCVAEAVIARYNAGRRVGRLHPL